MPDVDMAQLRTEMPKTSVHEFLEVELELSNTTVEALESKLKRMRDISIEDHLKPRVALLENVGLSRQQVAKLLQRSQPEAESGLS